MERTAAFVDGLEPALRDRALTSVDHAIDIAVYRSDGGRLAKAAAPLWRTTPPQTAELYDRRRDAITLGEIERIRL